MTLPSRHQYNLNMDVWRNFGRMVVAQRCAGLDRQSRGQNITPPFWRERGYKAGANALSSVHKPFTAPKPETGKADPENGHRGGFRRGHDLPQQRQVQIVGMDADAAGHIFEQGKIVSGLKTADSRRVQEDIEKVARSRIKSAELGHIGIQRSCGASN
jgi:hypothetical protein